MRVLFATDGSSCAEEAARFLSSASFARKPDLTLLTVTYSPEESGKHSIQPWLPEWQQSQQGYVDRLHEQLESQFSEQCESVSKLHLHGNVAHQILEQASELDADLIVIGAIGHSMISRIILGSVSDNVATHAKCSVVVVRPPTDGAGANPLTHNITIAYDGSSAATEAVTEISEVRWNRDSEISVVTVMQEPDYLLAGGVSTSAIVNEEQFFERMRQNCEEATNRVTEILPKAKSQTVRAHHVGDTIVKTAVDNGSDLIIIGDAGHNVVEELIVGSTAKYVLRHAPCSVWISRHHRG